MEDQQYVPQSNIPLSEDPYYREKQYAYVVRKLNDLQPNGSDSYTLEQYKKVNRL